VSAFAPDYFIDEASVRAAYQPPHNSTRLIRVRVEGDFWLPKPEPFDREMLSRRLRLTLFGEPAWITTAEDSILHKASLEQDHALGTAVGGRCGVVAVQAERLDKRYLGKWPKDLVFWLS